jgi:hypothetical protein
MRKDRKKESSVRAKPTSSIGTPNNSQSHIKNYEAQQSTKKSHQWLGGACVFLITLIIYLLTLPRSVTFEDSGLFILAAKYWGVAHPPGYPLYTSLGYIFSHLPISTLGFRISLLSAVLGATSAMICYFIFVQLSGRLLLSSFAALVLFTSAIVWSQMIVAEVYPLHLFFICALVYLLVRAQHKEILSSQFVLLFAFMLGLSLTNHWPLIVLNGPAFLFLCRKEWFTKKNILLFSAGAVVGLFPYLVMYWRSHADPEISFLGPIRSLSELLHYILRSYYAGSDKSILYSWADAGQFILDFVKSLTYLDFFPALILLSVLGVYDLWRKKNFKMFIAIIFMLLSSTVMLQLFLKLEYNDLTKNIYKVFWLTPYLAFVWLSFYGGLLLEKKRQWSGVAILACSFIFQICFFYKNNDFSQDSFAEDYGRVILSGVPDNNILFASTDGDVGPIAYVHLGLEERPLIEMYTGTSVLLKNRVFDPLTQEPKHKLIADFISQRERVYSVKNLPTFNAKDSASIGFNFNGLLYEYSSRAITTTPISSQNLTMTVKALDGYLKHFAINNWNFHRDTLASRLCNLLVLNGNESHSIFSKSPGCMQVLARHQAKTGRREAADKSFMLWFKQLKNPILKEKQEFLYHFLINRLEIINRMAGQVDYRMSLLNEGISMVTPMLHEYPLCDNILGPLLSSMKGSVSFDKTTLDQLKIFDDCKK